MTEKNIVINIKNKQGTIFTFRGDTVAAAEALVAEATASTLLSSISDLESAILGGGDAVAVVQAALGGTVINTPTAAPAFAPVPPPATPAVVGGRICQHGPMIGRKGSGAKGEWKGYFCPTPKGTVDQCPPQWLTKKDAEWVTI